MNSAVITYTITRSFIIDVSLLWRLSIFIGVLILLYGIVIFFLKNKTFNTIQKRTQYKRKHISSVAIKPMHTEEIRVENSLNKEEINDVIKAFNHWPLTTDDDELLELQFLPVVKEAVSLESKKKIIPIDEDLEEKTNMRTHLNQSIATSKMGILNSDDRLPNYDSDAFKHLKITYAKIANNFAKEQMEKVTKEIPKNKLIIPLINDQIMKIPFSLTPNEEIDNNKGIGLGEDVLARTESVFRQLYFDNDTYNKMLLLDTIEDSGDQREIPLLKEIILYEENNILKEKALKLLNGIACENYYFNPLESKLVSFDDCRKGSVFEQLFYYADSSTKVILLNEIMSIGSQKELLFLQTIADYPDILIRNKIREVIPVLLKENQLNTELDEAQTLIPFTKIPIENQIKLENNLVCKPSDDLNNLLSHENQNISTDSIHMELWPLEFYFLLEELKIGLPEKSDILTIDFELTEEYHLDNLPKNKTIIEHLNTLKEKYTSPINLKIISHTIMHKLSR